MSAFEFDLDQIQIAKFYRTNVVIEGNRQKRPMKSRDFRTILCSVLLLATQSASAATASGSGAFAFAALVALHSPIFDMGDLLLMRRLFDGHFHQLRGDTKTISVAADAIVCSAGHVDITMHSCKLTFGTKTTNLTGRAAHELYATMAQVGVPSEGAAGAMSVSISHLVCTIKPLEIARRAGGGADCTFDAGAAK